MTDDDWFERALTEEEAAEADDEGRSADSADDGPGPEGAPDDEPGSERAPGSDGEGSGGEALFDEDFESELEAAGGGGGDGGPFGGGGDSPFGGGGAGGAFGDGPAGDVGAGDTALGGGGQFGFGEFGDQAAESADFSEADLDSDIDRIDLGIEGLDDMIRGGVPDSSLMAVIGSAGTGKTTFGLQFLQQGLANGERTIYITLEESQERIVRSAEEKGWPFREHVTEGRLAVVDMDPIEMANSLSSIRSELPRLIDRFGATRLVLDSVSLLEMMYEDRATRRNEIYTFARSLKESGVTVLLTSEADEDNPYASRHGIVEYLTDAVYILQYVRPSDFQEARLAVEIQKIRDAHHSREMKPYEITDEGLSVYRQANIF